MSRATRPSGAEGERDSATGSFRKLLRSTMGRAATEGRLRQSARAFCLCLMGGAGFLGCAKEEISDQGWVYQGGDFANTHYSPLDEIDASNLSRLKLAWRWKSIEAEVTSARRDIRSGGFKSTPLVAGGVMYILTSLCQVAALDPGTGQMLWSFDPRSYEAGRPINIGFQHRGLSYWGEGKDARIFVATHDRKLWALDAATGKPCKGFGADGVVNLEEGYGQPIVPNDITHNSPVGLCRDTVIVGSSIRDAIYQKEMTPGHVRGYDALTGVMKWRFNTVPQGDEFGTETWENESWRYSGNTNVWAPMSSDEELGYVYLPLSTATNDMYGAERLGDNLFSESIVCLDAETGKRVWHFQAVHHGLWDYDFPAAPNLADVEIDGKPRKILAQVSKQGFLYVLDRVTGEPIWPIEERPVPPSRVPGERAAPTQPFPTHPKPYDRQGISEADLIDFTPELRAAALKATEAYEMGGLYTPPNHEEGTLGFPSGGGAANWQGAALDPDTGVLYIPSQTLLGYWRAVPGDPNRTRLRYVSSFVIVGPRYDPILEGLPLYKPPYSRVTAIDLNTGNHVWMTPNGDGPIHHPKLAPLRLTNLGQLESGAGGPLLTRTLLFVARSAAESGTKLDTTPRITVFDKTDGRILGHIPLPSSPYGNPITYSHEGRQYLVVAIGSGGVSGGVGPGLLKNRAAPPELVAFTLQ